MLAYARNFGLPATVLRYFSIFGPRQRPDMGYHIFIERILRGEEITIDGDGSQTRGNTYIDDCVEATIRAAAHGPTGEVFNIGGGEQVSALDVIRMIERITGREAHLRYGPPRAGEQRHALADTSKARRTFGWTPRTGVEGSARADRVAAGEDGGPGDRAGRGHGERRMSTTATHAFPSRRSATVQLPVSEGGRPEISIVIPLFNEVETVPELGRRLTSALEALGRSWEVIIVDDGSSDGSFAALRALHETDPRSP